MQAASTGEGDGIGADPSVVDTAAGWLVYLFSGTRPLLEPQTSLSKSLKTTGQEDPPDKDRQATRVVRRCLAQPTKT